MIGKKFVNKLEPVFSEFQSALMFAVLGWIFLIFNQFVVDFVTALRKTTFVSFLWRFCEKQLCPAFRWILAIALPEWMLANASLKPTPQLAHATLNMVRNLSSNDACRIRKCKQQWTTGKLAAAHGIKCFRTAWTKTVAWNGKCRRRISTIRTNVMQTWKRWWTNAIIKHYSATNMQNATIAMPLRKVERTQMQNNRLWNKRSILAKVDKNLWNKRSIFARVDKILWNKRSILARVDKFFFYRFLIKFSCA